MRTHINRYPTPAHTYYVDATGGSDTNIGTEEALPWQTVAKFNAYTNFKPGDRVLWKRGETWSGTRIIIPGSGLPGRPFVLGAYGSGAAPIITGSAEGSIFSSTSQRRDICVRDLAVNGNNASAYGIHFKYCFGISIENCESYGCTSFGVYIEGPVAQCSRVVILGGSYHNNAVAGIDVYVSAGGEAASSGLIDGATCYSNGTTIGHHGIYMRWCRGWTVRNVTGYGNSGALIKFNNVEDSLVDGCYGYQNGYGFYFGDMAESAGCLSNQIRNCVWADNTYGIQLNTGTIQNNLVYHNTIVKNISGILIANNAGTTGNVFKNNLISQANLRAASKCLYTAGAHTVYEAQTWDYNLYYQPGSANLFDASDGDLTWTAWKAISGSPDAHGVNADPTLADISTAQTTVDGDSAAAQKVLNTAATDGFVAGNRVLVNHGGPRQEIGTIDTVQDGVSLTMTVNLTYEHTAVQADKVDNLAYTDLHLLAGSPAINAADATLGIQSDKDGVVRGASVDIGAYEYV